MVKFLLKEVVPADEKCKPNSSLLKNNPMCIRCINDECAECKVLSSLSDTIINKYNNSDIPSKCICNQGYIYNDTKNKCGKFFSLIKKC